MKTKYVLVECGEGFKNTYTTERVALDAVARGTISSYRPVTLREIKELCANEYREDHYFRHLAEEEFIAKYDGKRFQAKVLDGGNLTEMLVSIIGAEELHLQTVYACNIQGRKTWYSETACVYYETGQVVEVELKAFSGFKLFVNGTTPGILDEERWNRIKNQDLAFRCDENGNAVTGLFK